MFPLVNRCCYCFSLRAGSIAIGSYLAIAGFSIAIFYLSLKEVDLVEYLLIKYGFVDGAVGFVILGTMLMGRRTCVKVAASCLVITEGIVLAVITVLFLILGDLLFRMFAFEMSIFLLKYYFGMVLWSYAEPQDDIRGTAPPRRTHMSTNIRAHT
ncbi:hypothetical protein J6590_033873 [Homalodisca vitripennis]|nr:hypothetical protein J6590_033873 [Homalodisca vitripennis]